jgi:glycine hydroxymethyltransferase
MKIKKVIQDEITYQQEQLKLIPSENYTYPEVLEAVGSVLMNKYAEGYPGKRYYQGNQNIDKIEDTCRERALKLFKLSKDKWHANVQTVTGSIANLAVYNTILEPGDKIMSMYLPHGGHLSHGWQLGKDRPVSFTSKIFEIGYYHVDKESKVFDYDEIQRKAQKFNPKLIISGGTAYPRTIDHKVMSEIAHETGALYLADIAHEAGLIAADANPSPFPHADFVTMTTRKTLRGPIGSIIITRKKFAKKLDRSVFPGLQGGPMINSIAGIAIALKKAQTKAFKTYASQIISNANALAENLSNLGFDLITGGTDKHLILIDISNKQPDGLIAAHLLEAADIITNKNTIPFDKSKSPWRPSGLRIGTPSVTARGMTEAEMKEIAKFIDQTLNAVQIPLNSKSSRIAALIGKNPKIEEIKNRVHELTKRFPVYQDLS